MGPDGPHCLADDSCVDAESDHPTPHWYDPPGNLFDDAWPAPAPEYGHDDDGVASACAGSTPGWVDSYGDPCAWYERHDAPGCPVYGNLFEGNMGLPKDNCCHCKAGQGPTRAPAPTASPTARPSSGPTDSHVPTVS